METEHAIDALSALAQPTRLALFRWLIRQQPEAASAGAIGKALDLAPATLSFHLGILERAGLIAHEKRGRSRLYRARLDTMNALTGYLIEDCCDGNPAACPETLPGALCGTTADRSRRRSPHYKPIRGGHSK